jgi:hypothetical protein
VLKCVWICVEGNAVVILENNCWNNVLLSSILSFIHFIYDDTVACIYITLYTRITCLLMKPLLSARVTHRKKLQR